MNGIDQERNKVYESPEDAARRHEARGYRKGYFTCAHIFDTRLCCDGREHYYPCVRAGCNERQYFCKHLPDDRHCPQSPERRGDDRG